MRYRTFLIFCCLIMMGSIGMVWAQSCRRTFSTPQNNKQCITVGTNAVDIAAANSARCSMLIMNISVNGMNCTDVGVDGAPTSTSGTPILAGGSVALGSESQGRWQCIRSGGADAIACVVEGRP